MNSYGARLPTDDQQKMATLLRRNTGACANTPETVPEPRRWEHLSAVEFTGGPRRRLDPQMHDFLLHPNGHVYIGDNLFDRIYELDPNTGEYTVSKVPHDEDMGLGGIMGNRFKVFPKMYNYLGVHLRLFKEKTAIFYYPLHAASPAGV